jgi:type IX secretion system PorP/SprF family membrane protein
MKIQFLYLLLSLILIPSLSHAQQDPIYALYLNNPLTINPAYAGINDQFSARFQYRTQWAGLEANPKTFNFSGNVSMVQNKVGLGLMALQDKLGDIRNLEISIPVSYKIQLNNWNTLSFGMQAGIVNQRNDPSQLTIQDPDDPLFGSFSETKFNLGAGLMFKNDKLRIGLSVPRLLPATINTSGESIELYKQHYYLFSSYILEINPNLWFRPSVLFRGTKGTPLSADVNATFTWRENYSAGLFTRNFKTFGALVQILFENYHLAYVFEFPHAKDSDLRFSSHEITLGISMALFTYHDVSPKVY